MLLRTIHSLANSSADSTFFAATGMRLPPPNIESGVVTRNLSETTPPEPYPIIFLNGSIISDYTKSFDFTILRVNRAEEYPENEENY